MLDPYKIRLMTRAEKISQEEERGTFRVKIFEVFDRSDYVSRGMRRSFIGVTVTFVLFLVLYCMYAELELTLASLVSNIYALLICAAVYFAVCIFFLIFSFIFYRLRYRKLETRQEEYKDCLLKLKRLQ